MPTKPKINVRLLRRIQKQIAKEPRQFDMESYFWHAPSEIPNCGTACCIGGWAITLAKKFKTPDLAREAQYSVHARWVDSKNDARLALCLTHEQADRLFYEGSWPKKFYDAYRGAATSPRRARIAIRRIDHFIKTEGRS